MPTNSLTLTPNPNCCLIKNSTFTAKTEIMELNTLTETSHWINNFSCKHSNKSFFIIYRFELLLWFVCSYVQFLFPGVGSLFPDCVSLVGYFSALIFFSVYLSGLALLLISHFTKSIQFLIDSCFLSFLPSKTLHLDPAHPCVSGIPSCYKRPNHFDVQKAY